ncbi:hypothetical protein BDZ97DRAFT_1772741 [Flammula alnicola]|nr:hypothetical protein BDZ97DRAFT_1772741 [Flammula alnicola]
MGSEGHGQGVPFPPVSPLKRTVSTWRKSMPSIPSLGLGPGAGDSHAGGWKREDELRQVEASKRDGHGSTSPTVGKPVRKHTVRELAILPTQRVMRYVLLYRDLLAHTPSSSNSRVFVERAVEAACRIADKCDCAQGNAAFIVSGSTSPNGNSNHGTANPTVTGNFTARSGSGASRRSPSSSRQEGLVSVSGSRASSSSASHSTATASTSTASTSTSSASATSVSSNPPSLPSTPHAKDASITVNVISGTNLGTNPSAGNVRRTSMSAVSLMTSMGWGRSRATVPMTLAVRPAPITIPPAGPIPVVIAAGGSDSAIN